MNRSWLVPASTAFFATTAALLGGTLLGPGCQTRCDRNFDCGGGAFCSSGRCETQCYTDLDCTNPAACEGNPGACAPLGLRCNSTGRCVGQLRPHPPGDPDGVVPVPEPPHLDGWEDDPAAGKAFIVNQIAIASQDRGFNLDNDCSNGHCIDNFLWRLGELGNDQIRQGLLGGESLLLIELAGLTEPYHGDDPSMTVKIYGARDADDPFFPANNFRIPPGHTSCCQFKINPQSLVAESAGSVGLQARARAPARIDRGKLRSLAPVPIQFTLTVGVAPHPEIRLERVMLTGRLPSLDGLEDGLLGGAVPVTTLAQTENPYCKTVSPRCPTALTDSTLIDLVSTLIDPRPDIDLDFDGNECVIDTDGDGAIDLCCDGNGTPGTGCRSGITQCPSLTEVESTDPRFPSKCTGAPEIADGYSIGITFTAIAAKIVGIGQ